jgi:hypothetical protein
VYVIGRRYCNKYCLWANCSDRSLKYHNIVFSFVHCVVCSSPIYGFWLPLWYRQTLPMDTNKTSVSTGFLSDFGTVRGGCISVFFSPFYYFITPNEHCYQLYHAEYKLHFNDMMMMLDYYSARSLTPLSMGRHVTPLVHNIMIPSQPLFALPTT